VRPENLNGMKGVGQQEEGYRSLVPRIRENFIAVGERGKSLEVKKKKTVHAPLIPRRRGVPKLTKEGEEDHTSRLAGADYHRRPGNSIL